MKVEKWNAEGEKNYKLLEFWRFTVAHSHIPAPRKTRLMQKNAEKTKVHSTILGRSIPKMKRKDEHAQKFKE